MKSFSDLSVEELNKMDKRVLITIIVSLQSQLNTISSQLDFLTEQIALMNQRSFGKKTEQMDQFQQLTIFDFFNETEALSDDSPEPEITEVVISTHTRRKKTKREDQLEGLPARIFEHTIEKEELSQLFPEGYKELPVETYKRVSIIPQTILVDEHHIHVYASKNNDGTIVRADRPVDLFRNSVATPSLVASIMTGKYQNHLPLERQVQAFKANGIKLETNTLANWMMLASDKYLNKVYDELVRQLKTLSVIHADETPFRVIGKPRIDDDGKSLADKSYMWVYWNADCNPEMPVV
ncbi:MAG: transposase, partial [Lachnospiraceae bacterium]|nr:transposase [Lachnospiraceae bacterium]